MGDEEGGLGADGYFCQVPSLFEEDAGGLLLSDEGGQTRRRKE